MRYLELTLEPVDRMNEDDSAVLWASIESEAPPLCSFATTTDALDARLIQLIRTLDR